MDDKTGIFTFTHEVSKRQSGIEIKRKVEWAKQYLDRQAQDVIVKCISSGRLYIVARTETYIDRGGHPSDLIRLMQRALVALSDWTDAQVGDCVVGEEGFLEAFEMRSGEVWLFQPYGIFPMVGPNASSTTRLKIYQRKR